MEGILGWYGESSEVQFTGGGRGGGGENFGILESISVCCIDSRGTWGKKWYGQYRSDRTVSDAPVTRDLSAVSGSGLGKI